jgi:protein Shroom
LVERLSNKLKVLETEQMMLAEESSVNDALGHEVAFKVAQKLKPADSTKFRSFVDDVGYITMLLLSLSGRLARIENALHSIGEKSADKVSGMFHSCERALRKQIITYEPIF